VDRTRNVVVLASLFAVSILVATTAVAAPAGRPEAGPKRAPAARSAGNRHGRPEAAAGKSARVRPSAPSRTAKPHSRKAPSAPKTRAPTGRTPPPRQTAPPTRGIQPKRTASPRRTTPRLWERRHQRDERGTAAPRRRVPNVTNTPNVRAARNGFADRPRSNDRPGRSGHGPKRRKHGHHHHAYCGCYLRDWSRLLYGYVENYRSRYACDPYDDRYGSRTTYITFGTQLPFDGYGPLPCTATGSGAWALLTDGQAAAAYEAFECLSPAVPDDGYLLIGLSLSAAAVGEHDLAVTALRTAMRVDPVSLLDVPGGDRLDVLISHTADHYHARARTDYGDVDALFMVAALRYLLGQDAIAHYAIEIAITLDDVDPSTRNLKGLIEASPADAALRRAH